MALLGQALNPGYYWSGTKVCAGPGAPRYQGAVACWEYYRAPADVFASVAYPPPPPPSLPPPSPGLPSILPPVERPADQPAPVADKACGGCRKSTTTPTNSLSGVSAPTPTPGARSAPMSSVPWWLYVLAALTLAQVVYGRND